MPPASAIGRRAPGHGPRRRGGLGQPGRQVMQRGHERQVEAHRGHVVEDHAVGRGEVRPQRGRDLALQVGESQSVRPSSAALVAATIEDEANRAAGTGRP